MRRIGVRHIDNRRSLLPRDYFDDPWAFGLERARCILPPGGDEVSQRIAFQQHRLVLAVRSRGVRSTLPCDRYGFSREIWSQVMGGHRWCGETVLMAIIEALASNAT